MKVYRDDQRVVTRRINVLLWLVATGFLVLMASFWYVQAVQAERFRGLSESNRLRAVEIKARRGLIRERSGRLLVDNQPGYSMMLVRSDMREVDRRKPGHRERLLEFVADVIGTEPKDVENRIARFENLPSSEPVAIYEGLNISQVAKIEANKLSFPSLYVSTIQRRNYRYDTMASHVLGYIGEVTRADLEKQDILEPGDPIGKRGIELVYDSALRGRDGMRYVVVDSHGKTLSELASARKDPAFGNDVFLTLDLELQRRAERYFIDNGLVGAAVALDPRNGEILAMVSSPQFDPNTYSQRLSAADWKMILSNPFQVEVNRVVQGLYSPGSVFKTVIAMAGLQTGTITQDTTFFCPGSQTFYGRRFRCWKKQGHGTVNLETALKESCDVFFYNVGARLGISRIERFSRSLTFGERSRIDLTGEKTGLIPSEAWARSQGRRWYPSETVSVAIGQGPLLVTPLQVVNMMAAIANGGRVYQPHLLRMIESTQDDGSVTRTRTVPHIIHEVHLDPAGLETIRRGLWRAVNEPGGTGGAARVDGLDIVGKTGTVQVISQEDWVKAEDLPFRYRDHAWFASFAPKNNPRLVVVVFVEHGGHGGSQAAPLAAILYRDWLGRARH